jgi:hypothetical protein
LAVVGTIATLAPALFPAQTMSRLSVAGTVTTSDRALLAGALRDLATSGAGADSPGVPASGPGVDPASRQPSNGASARDRALYRWEAAVAGQTASLDSRITESLYFIEETRSSVRNLLFGAGAGWSVSIVASRQGELRVVRGAHNTYVTLVFRHGLVFGLPLIVFVLVFGLRRHLRQWRDAASPEWAVLLLALLAYRGAATIMAVFHQGLFDDPLVFLSIAAATTLPAPTGGGVDATLPGDARPPDHEYHRGVDHRP